MHGRRREKRHKKTVMHRIAARGNSGDALKTEQLMLVVTRLYIYRITGVFGFSSRRTGQVSADSHPSHAGNLKS